MQRGRANSVARKAHWLYQGSLPQGDCEELLETVNDVLCDDKVASAPTLAPASGADHLLWLADQMKEKIWLFQLSFGFFCPFQEATFETFYVLGFYHICVVSGSVCILGDLRSRR